MNLYTDSICDKPVDVLDSDKPDREQQEDQDQLSPSDGSFHGVCTDMEEFSELLSRVSTKVLWFQLMTQPQRTQARHLWCQDNPDATPEPQEPDGIEAFREYSERLIKEEHVHQWETAFKQGKIL